MLLCPSNIGIANKRETVETIWSWSDESFDRHSRWLSDAVLTGAGSAGTAFNTQRWRELRFFVGFIEAFRKLESELRAAILADGWKFAAWINDVPDAGSRQLRHMMMYLMFPDDFERVFGRSDRRRIVRAFTAISDARAASLSPLEIDRELKAIRVAQEEKFQTKEVDFYSPPLEEIWQPVEPPVVEVEAEVTSEFAELAKAMRHDHVLQAIREVDRDGFPHEARSTTYDLVYAANRYPPKYIFALAAKYATGSELSRREFSGGESSQCFKLLRELKFSIERKDFISDLVQKFLKQADEGVDLAVSDYPKSYRELSVNVSFGKGNIARIPWISFTGFDQTTSNGIYPVLLYYRALGRLIVAFGISETNAPKVSWDSVAQSPTIEANFAREGLTMPERYGASHVHKAFDLSESVDLEGIQRALDEVIGRYRAQFEAVVAGDPPKTEPSALYTVVEALDGLFIDEQQFQAILALLRVKKNVILQGPPGVGKTFVCKRLAYALMGEKAPHRLQMVQFHQAYSYEDFVQGFRPSGQGFRLKNGLFYEFCDLARNDPGFKYVFVIDEINRGNLSKVLGEVMMLIEPDKRGPEWAIPLTYSESGADRFYVPENVYLIGLMNTADRSLAMVDYALRRRFGFVDLAPQFDSDQFRDFMEERGADQALIEMVVTRMSGLNARIAEDLTNLGPGYRVGHSFFCTVSAGTKLDWTWYRLVIEGEVGPLLREYYFDNPSKAEALLQELLRHE